MTKGEAVNWIINLSAAIGKIQHQDLWHYEQALAEIKEMLEAEPVQKTGKWIELDSDEERYDVIKCPYCKHTFTVDSYHWTDIGFVKDDFKFCPNCGERMECEEE